MLYAINVHRTLFCYRTPVGRDLARTTRPVKPVLQTKDISVCVLLDSRENTARQV